MRGYNLHFPATTCHYLIADAAGKTAAVEFLDGRVEVTGTEESWQVSTNDRLSGKSEAENDRACWRYRKASDRVAGLDGNLDVPGMLDVMASVSVKDWTMWTSVYNLTTGEYEIAYRRNFDDVFPGRLAMRSAPPPARAARPVLSGSTTRIASGESWIRRGISDSMTLVPLETSA